MFNYVDTSLGSYDEYKNLLYTITYTDELGTTYPVTVSTDTPHPTVNVSGNTISGYFAGLSTYKVNYINKNDQKVEVNNFNSIVNYREVYNYEPSTQEPLTFTYTATALDGNTAIATKQYTITLTNDWAYTKNQFLKYVRPDKYKVGGITVVWVNSSGQTIPMLDVYENPVTWENEL